MSANLICSLITPLLDAYQGFLNFAYSFVSFLGLSAPNARSVFGSFLGCS
jgi:hypothetical protein